MAVTNAQLRAIIVAGSVVEYRGRIIRVVGDLPTDAQLTQDAADYGTVYQVGFGPSLPASGTNGQVVVFDSTAATGTAAQTGATPAAHHTAHANGGSDPIVATLTTQVTGILPVANGGMGV